MINRGNLVLPLDFATWKKRMQRADLSSSLVHLTRGALIAGSELNAIDVLIKILLEKKINEATLAKRLFMAIAGLFVFRMPRCMG
jgi:hypothetical protein